MIKQKWTFYLGALILLQLTFALPSIADEYDVSDIALTPGADETRLNLNWHTNSATFEDVETEVTADDGTVSTTTTSELVDECAVELSKKRNEHNKFFFQFFRFPKNSRIFEGTKASAGADEDGADDYFCEVEVTGLENQSEYFYRIGDGNGNWSDRYEYSTANKNRYGFIFAADSQIGASGPKDLSRSSEVKPYIIEYYETNDTPSEATIEAYLKYKNPYDEEETELYSDDAGYEEYIAGLLAEVLEDVVGYIYDPIFYDEYSEEGSDTDLGDLAAVDQTLADDILDMIAERLAEQKDAIDDDTAGWVKSLDVISEKFPKPAFILTSGDQVENAKECEWTGFFSPEQMTSIPVAPAIGSHDSGANFGYHFNLPNESTTYGVSTTGADYYFTYGNALFIVLNMDATMNEYPRSAPPSGGSPPSGTPPSGGGSSDECAGIDDDATFDETLAELENYCTTEEVTDEVTGEVTEVTTCIDKLEDFKASIDEHAAFIQEAIDANPMARWKIVNWHYSIFSAGNHSAEDVIRAMKVYMFPVLADADIDLGLMAHDHVYTRTYQMVYDEENFDDDPVYESDLLIGKDGEVINPPGTLYLTGATVSGSKYYSLNNCYDCDEPDDYYEYVALGDDMSRTDDNDTPDDTTDDEAYNMKSFTYIDVDNNSLRISVNAYRITDEDTGDYTMESIDTYTIVKQEPRKPHPPYKK